LRLFQNHVLEQAQLTILRKKSLYKEAFPKLQFLGKPPRPGHFIHLIDGGLYKDYV
jgi:hypothetical protein